MEKPKPSPASRLGLHNDQGDISLSKQSVLGAVGGWIGVVESILPALIFVTTLAITKQTLVSVIAAASVSATFLIIQIVRKKPITQAVAGAIGIAISAFLPLRDGGQAADYFLQGFFTNAIYFAVLLVSVLIRWPIVRILPGFRS
jgi:hypothetical protein